MHTITIVDNRIIARDIHAIHAVVNPERPLTFKAGQFCMVNIPHNGTTVPRAYSFGSDAHDPTNLIFYVKILRDGNEHVASPYFEHCTPGDTLNIQHPSGFMTLPEQLPDNIVYLATTTGIAPFLSHLYSIARTHPNQHVDLIFGCRHNDDLFAREELNLLQQKMPNLAIITTLTQPSKAWSGNTGRVTDYLTRYTANDDCMFYLCGNKFMIIDARKKITELGFDTRRIKFEIFF